MTSNAVAARLEVIDAGDKVLASYPLTASPTVIGRSMHCALWIDDPHIAPRHCSLVLDANGIVQLDVLPSANGVQRMDRSANVALQSSEVVDQTVLLLGTTRLRVRIQDQTQFAPEILVAPPTPVSNGAERAKRAGAANQGTSWLKIIIVLGLIYFIELIGFYTRLTGEPKLAAVLSSMLGLALFIGAWTAGWSILSRIFSGETKFKGHLLIALLAVLISSVWNEILDLLGFGFSLRQVDLLDTVSRVFVATIASYFHLKLISAERLMHKGMGLAATFFVGLGILGLVQFDQIKRLRQSAIYSASKPAAFELKASKSLDQVINQFNTEKIIIDIQRKEKPPEASDFSFFDDD